MRMKRFKPKVYVLRLIHFVLLNIGGFQCAQLFRGSFLHHLNICWFAVLLFRGLTIECFLQEPQSAPAAFKDDVESVNRLRKLHMERQHVCTCKHQYLIGHRS